MQQGFLECVAWWAVQEGEVQDIVDTARLHRENCLAEIAAQDFGRGALIHLGVAGFGVESVALSWCFTTGSSFALDCGGFGDGLDEE